MLLLVSLCALFSIASSASIPVIFDPSGCKGANEVGTVGDLNATSGCTLASGDIQDVQARLTGVISWTLGSGDVATIVHIHCGANKTGNSDTKITLFNQSATAANPATMVNLNNFQITSFCISQIKNGLAYINIHSATFPSGAVRAQFNATDPDRNTPASTTVPPVSSASSLLAGLSAGILAVLMW